MKAFAGMGIFIALFFVFGTVSCSRDKADKPGETLSVEESKKAEVFQKSFMESKKAVVAKVNGVEILMFDLLSEMNAMAPQYLKPGQGNSPQSDAKLKKEALDRLIYRELAVQEAKKQGMKVPSGSIDNEINRIKKTMKSEAAYRKRLAADGLSEEELRKETERNILVSMITEKEIFDKIRIDPDLIKKTYEREKASYKGASGQMSFEEAKPIIEEKLMTPRVQKLEDEWVDKMKKNARIENFLGEFSSGIQGVR